MSEDENAADGALVHGERMSGETGRRMSAAGHPPLLLKGAGGNEIKAEAFSPAGEIREVKAFGEGNPVAGGGADGDDHAVR